MNPIVFIHGFLLSGWVFTTMEKYFRGKGRHCLYFNYSSRSNSIVQTTALLERWLVDKKISSPDFVCHSMGGLVCHKFAIDYAAKMDGTAAVVCLGTPFGGSLVARNLSNSESGRRVLGALADSELLHGVDAWTASPRLGVIAGSRHIGIGRMLGLPGNEPGDGTILVKETEIKDATDHIILPVTHSQMTFSKPVARQAEHFINLGSFNHDQYPEHPGQ